MKKLFLVQMFIGFAVMAVGQTGKLKGIIYDSTTRTPLELATVSIHNPDSSLVTYQLSDKKGAVSFDKLPLKKGLFVSVSYVGYNTYHSLLEQIGKDTLHVFLSFNTRDTNSVVVKSTIPVRMNGDTLEINPAAFKMKENQVVEELLNQVPGITIWSDGSITMGGRKIQNLFVDGKPFVGSTDPRIATQNLPKSAIDKIQLYQEYDRANIGKSEKQPTDSILTMNIKLKESAQKGYFGKAGIGYGTDTRTESDLVMQMYDKKSSIGIGGGYNNINKDIGGVNQMLQNNTYRTSSPDLYRVGRFGANGINKSHSIGGLYTHNFKEVNNSRQNDRLTVNYNQSGTDSWVLTQRVQDRIGVGYEEFVKDESQQINNVNRHNLDINYMKTNSYNDNLNISGSTGFQKNKGISSQYTEITDAHGLLQSTNSVISKQNGNSDNESLNLNFAKNDYDNPLTNMQLTGNIQHGNSSSAREVVSVFNSMTVNSKDTSYNRRYNDNNESFNAHANLSYGGLKRLLFGRYNLGGIDLSLLQDVNYSQITSNSVVSDFDSSSKNYITNKNLTNDNHKKTIGYVPNLSLSKNFSKPGFKMYKNFSLQARLIGDIRVEKNISSIAQRNLDRSFQFFRYDGSMNYSIYHAQKYSWNSSLNYSKNFDYPSIDALYTIVDDINVYNITVGNPYLKNKTIHNLNLFSNFNTQNPQSKYPINGNFSAGFTLSQNPVTDSVINAPSGKRISYYINADQSKNIYLNYSFNISRRVKKNTMQVMYIGNYTSGMQPNYIDGVYNLSKSSNLTNQLGFRFSLGSTLIIGITERLQQSWVNQTLTILNYFKNSLSTTNFNVNVNYPKNFSFGSTLDYIKNSTLQEPTILWNAFATCRVMKEQGELKLSAMDILKQYKNIYNSANAYGTSTTVSNGLQQYFMLTFAYYPRKFGKKAGDKRVEEF